MTHIVRRRLCAGLTVGLLAATLIAPGVATAGPRSDSVPACMMHPLPLPAGVSLARERMFTDPAGQVIVGTGSRTTDQGRESLLLRWDGPRVTVLTRSPGSLLAVNRQGVLIGEGPSEAGYPPWRYRDGQLEWLPRAPNGIGGYVMAINGRGDMVGFGGYLEYPEPLLWPADRPGTVERFEPTGYPVAIFDDGTIVGVAPAEEDRSPGVAGVRHPARREGLPPPVAWVRRPDGRIDRLTAAGADMSTVVAARGNWAVGYVGTTANGQFDRMMRWDLRTGVATPVKPGLSYLTGVDSSGSLLADATVDHFGRRVPLRGVAWDASTGLSADAIADNGTVVGSTPGRPLRWSGC